ncbi:tobamovirus multiplication protein 2A isoform X2 [Beta vulgaris subsp. vulgaris]|uniref:tobamovirus multiplication protein 2A isoform X2 n=1 Tax=Beta vulgaris subsp. vulgaris TaxID=3555 RepID=UPI002037045A|nr:tobamovirus multiplication protein 2A isoform X2 [Beta vulgaris subsp. vulgaris]
MSFKGYPQLATNKKEKNNNNKNVHLFLSPLKFWNPSLSLSSNFLKSEAFSSFIAISTLKFIYMFIGIGAVLFVISCFGCIGASTKNGCCLSTYAVFIILLILLELGCAAFVFFDKNWNDEIPTDKTGNFDMINDFLEEHWSIAKWVLLGIVVLEAALFLLTVIVRSMNRPADYDSDEEFINQRQSAKQPLINRPPPATGVPVAGAIDQRPSRNDAWSARMREKYGLDTSEFTYNPTESGRYQQPAAQPTVEGNRCTIM